MITPDSTQYQSSVVGVHWLAELHFTSGVQRLTTAPRNVTAGGYSWMGLGVFAGVSDIGESADSGAEQIELSLSLVDTAMLAATLGNVEGYRGRRVRLHQLWLDAAFQPVGTPTLRWAGYMEPIKVEREAPSLIGDVEASGRIVMPCSRSGMARARHAQGLRLTNAQQRARFPDDRGLEYVRSLIELPSLWLSKKFQTK